MTARVMAEARDYSLLRRFHKAGFEQVRKTGPGRRRRRGLANYVCFFTGDSPGSSRGCG
jgi:hypothetical protein